MDEMLVQTETSDIQGEILEVLRGISSKLDTVQDDLHTLAASQVSEASEEVLLGEPETQFSADAEPGTEAETETEPLYREALQGIQVSLDNIGGRLDSMDYQPTMTEIRDLNNDMIELSQASNSINFGIFAIVSVLVGALAVGLFFQIWRV